VLWLKAACLRRRFDTLAMMPPEMGSSTNVKMVSRADMLKSSTKNPMIVSGSLNTAVSVFTTEISTSCTSLVRRDISQREMRKRSGRGSGMRIGGAKQHIEQRNDQREVGNAEEDAQHHVHE
nr:hypothetical protein [Tanacetum cinerariifolium]